MNYELELHTHFQEHSPTTTSIEELADIWNCSTRYAKTIINRLASNNVIQWEVFRGRGKKPKLTLLRSKNEAIYEVFDELWNQEKFDKAYELLKEHQLLNHPLAEEWLLNRYGIQQLQTNKYIFRQPYSKVDVNFDPLYFLSRHDFHFAEQIHETLFIYNEESKKVETNMLFAYETEDFQTWRFILRKDILFHNHEPVKASDIKRSLERAAIFTNEMFTYMEIIIIDDYELTITLNKPFSLFTNCLASYRTAILPKDHKQGTIGCGAFKFVSNTDEKLQLDVFSHYFKQRPWIDGIEILYTRNMSSFAVASKPFDDTIPFTEMVFEENGADYVSLNGKTGPLSNPALRETIYSLIKAEDYVMHEWREIEANSWHYGEKLTKVHASTLIPPDQFPTLTIGVQQIREGVNHEREALILQTAIANYGIKSTIHIVDFKTTNEDISQQFDLFVGGYAVGRDVILSLIGVYMSPQNTVLGMLSEQEQQLCLDLFEETYSSDDHELMMNHLNQIETILLKTYSLKFLTHRTHWQYVRKDVNYKRIQFDSHGRIDYKGIYA